MTTGTETHTHEHTHRIAFTAYDAYLNMVHIHEHPDENDGDAEYHWAEGRDNHAHKH